MKRLFTLTFILIALGFLNTGYAQDFVYKATNPAFGGDTFNYNWLLSSAQAQNDITESISEETDPNAELDNFKESINSQILNEISSRIIQDQFGEEGLQEGSYLLGNYQVDVGQGSGGMTIDILDVNTGAQTQVTVPYF